MFRHLLTTAIALPCIAAHAQFAMQSSGTVADLRGIVSVGNGVAWASGTHGTVLRTKNGGTFWQGCAMPAEAENLDFRGIQAFDDRTAIVMSSGKGDLSRIYKTTDGCLSWKLVFTNPDAEGFFDAMQFATAQQGLILGDPIEVAGSSLFALFATEDVGQHWCSITRASASSMFPVLAYDHSAFAASNSALWFEGKAIGFWFGTGGGKGEPRIYSDGTPIRCTATVTLGGSVPIGVGSTTVPMAAGSSAGIFSVAFREKEPNTRTIQVVLVGGDYKKPDEVIGTAAYRQSPGPGKPSSTLWFAAQTPPHGYRSAVTYAPEWRSWLTVGPNGTDISRDDGRNWQPLRPGKDDQPDADRNWNALSLPFVVGPHGRIGRLRDDALGAPSSKTSTQGR